MITDPKNIAVIGASGAIGHALTKVLSNKYPNAHLSAFSRSKGHGIDYTDEDSIAEAADLASKNGLLDIVIIANGILHEHDIMPEKALKDLSLKKFHRVFQVNTVIPALIAKHFLPKLNKNVPSRFAVLSARVGSISDNQLGGWYAYRASKAALNMIIKNAAIEIGRRNKHAIIVGLHPGTVDSKLSKPFQSNVPDGKLFTPIDSANKLLGTLETLTPSQSGRCFAWDGAEVFP